MRKATVLVQYSCSIRINCFPKQLSAKQFRSQFFLPRRKLFQIGLADHLTLPLFESDYDGVLTGHKMATH